MAGKSKMRLKCVEYYSDNENVCQIPIFSVIGDSKVSTFDVSIMKRTHVLFDIGGSDKQLPERTMIYV